MEEEDEAISAPSRLFITIQTKLDLVLEMERRVYAQKSTTLKAFCREKEESLGVAIQPSQLRRWKNNLVNLKKTLDNCKNKRTKVAATTGRKSQLCKLDDRLLPWINSVRAQGVQVSVRMAAIRAKRYDPSLRHKKRYTLFQIVRRYLKANGVRVKSVTHKSQEDPRLKHQEATAFLVSTRPLLNQRNRTQRFIINMDQTPYNPTDSPNRTLDYIGSSTVASKKMKVSIGRITCCLAVCADGTKLRPMLVYKGKPGGSITTVH